MRILVHEYVSGGGLAGRPLPPSLAREGAAMLEALLADLAAIPGFEITTTMDPRVRLRPPGEVTVVPLPPGSRGVLPHLIEAAEAVWLIAPETRGTHARLAARVEAQGRMLLGSSAAAIRQAANKAVLARLLARAGIPTPATRVVPGATLQSGSSIAATGVPARAPVRDGIFSATSDEAARALVSVGTRSAATCGPAGVPAAEMEIQRAARELGYPVVVKPARGAGCEGVTRVQDPRGLGTAYESARASAGEGRILVQRYVAGTDASVTLVGDGARAVPLAVSAQHVVDDDGFRYTGGETPLDHPLAGRAVDRALQAFAAVPGLRGIVGVDLVLTDSDAVVIEINPRLTTAYLGVRAVLDANPAALAVDACHDILPSSPPRLGRRASFTNAGEVRVHSRRPPCHA